MLLDQVALENDSIENFESIYDLLKANLSGKKLKTVLAVRIDGELYDISSALPKDIKSIETVTLASDEGLELLRHSTAHIMADAVQKLFKDVKVTIGPSIANGFYYDFDAPQAFSIEDFEKIEKEMTNIIRANLPFERFEYSKDEAIKIFKEKNEDYKVEIINDLDVDTVSVYKCGEFLDLCRGPHIPSSSFIPSFKLMSVAGAYWRGNSDNKMLSRIYGTAFASEKELKAYLTRLEEAKKRDHRKLGKELELFTFSEDVAPGMVFWLPKGMLVRTILEDFLRKEHMKRGYELVQGPQILRRELWEKSGHYQNYRENMYFTEIHDDVKDTVDVHGVKPMNCVGHMIIYNNSNKSYRDLPQRLFELGVVHRHEKSGALHGLLRVRQFTQDDAHIICMPEQLEDEIFGVMKLSDDLMKLFGFEYRIMISTRPEKSIGSDEAWEIATSALINSVEKKGLQYTINEGDGAFYGPKIDIKVTDAIGREWQLSTIQVDFTLPERFDLNYIGTDNDKHRPVMVHRAILGSLERFIGVLTEHYAGAFPTWLAPEQARILTITDDHISYAREVQSYLQSQGIRVELDTRSEKLGYKVRQAQLEKVPYMLVIGDKEMEDAGVNVRPRIGDNLGFYSKEAFAEFILAECIEPFKAGGMNYRFA